jgi:hypothetical protein
VVKSGFFPGGRRGTLTPKHFVNLTGESKNFKMLDFPLNKPQILSLNAFIFSVLNHKVVIFLSQTESTPKHFFFRKKALGKVYWISEILLIKQGVRSKFKTTVICTRHLIPEITE